MLEAQGCRLRDMEVTAPAPGAEEQQKATRDLPGPVLNAIVCGREGRSETGCVVRSGRMQSPRPRHLQEAQVSGSCVIVWSFWADSRDKVFLSFVAELLKKMK